MEEGYSFVDDLLEADAEEPNQLAEGVQMKRPEARRFLKAVAERKSSAAPPPETPPGEYVCSISHELMRDPVSPPRPDLRAQCDRQVAPDQADRPDLQRSASPQEAGAELRAAGCDRAVGGAHPS